MVVKIPKWRAEAVKNLVASSDSWTLNEVAQLTGLMAMACELDDIKRSAGARPYNSQLEGLYQVALRGLTKSANANGGSQASAFSTAMQRVAERRAAREQ